MPGPEDPRSPVDPLVAFVEEKCWPALLHLIDPNDPLYKASYAELNIAQKLRIAVIDAINSEEPPMTDINVGEASELLGEILIRERGDIQ
jgi:hypothetical protein